VKRDGVVVSVPTPTRTSFVAPTITARNSYEFRVDVSRKLYDRAVGTITSPALANLATGASITIHPLDLERVGAAVGANVRISNAHSSIVLPVQSNEKVPRGTAVIPFNQPGADIRELVRHGDSVVDVRIESM
jgi:NADH-quinone oxidoreductase subunit G